MSKIICISGKAENGKSYLANTIKQNLETLGQRVLILNYGDHLKSIAKLYYGWNGVKDEAGRQLLQWLGTDVCRKNNPNIWVNVVKENILGLQSEFDTFIIGDCRFPNEIEVMQSSFSNVQTVRIERIGHVSKLTESQLQHPSETSLDKYIFDLRCEFPNGVKYIEDYVKKNIGVFL